MAKCQSCEREGDLRYGFCFECANAESIIADGTNMYDQGLGVERRYQHTFQKGQQGTPAKTNLEKVRLLVENGWTPPARQEVQEHAAN